MKHTTRHDTINKVLNKEQIKQMFVTLMPPIPQVDLRPTDLSINRDHFSSGTIYQPTLKFEASGAKRS